MSLSSTCIARPVATSLAMVGVALAGALAYRTLPVAPLPQVAYPTIVVATRLPGASPTTMATTVTTPLERSFGQMPGLDQMTSTSASGTSQITLQFGLARDIDAAEQDVQAAINAASALLPRALPGPPTYSKSNPADAPVMALALRGRDLPLRDLADVADSILAQQISQVSGVGLVTLGGAQKPAVRVQVDPEALATAQLTLEDVRTLLVAANVNQPKGSLDGPRQSMSLAVDDQLTAAARFRPLVLGYRDGAAITLDAVAEVVDGVEDRELSALADGEPAVVLTVQRQPGANIVAVVDKVTALLPALRRALPVGATLEVISDRTETVRAAIDDVQATLVLTTLLVIAVIYLFLGDLRATAIPAVAVPLSVLATFAAMAALGYSLDNLSLMALTIATGFIVDDAIVMLENAARLREDGMSAREAARVGADQIGFTVVSLTVSLVAVLLPLLLMGGLIGRLFREFAVTLSLAVVASAVISLTLTPTMCARLLRGAGSHRPGALARGFERGFARAQAAYAHGLTWVLARPRATLAAAALCLAMTVACAVAIPKGFFPAQDTGEVVGSVVGAPDASFAAMRARGAAVAEALRASPNVAHVAVFVGADGVNMAANVARLAVTLAPRTARHATGEAVLTDLRRRASAVAGVDVYLQATQDLQIDTRLRATPYQFTLEDADPAELAHWTPKLTARLAALPELRDVVADQASLGNAVALDIDRAAAGRLGVTVQAIDDVLYDAFGQRIVSTIFTQLNQYRVILEVLPALRQGPDALSRLFVHSADPGAGPVPLGAVVTPHRTVAPLAVSHQGQFAAATLSFATAPGVSLGAAVRAIEATVAAAAPPPGLRGSFVGTAAAFSAALADEVPLVLAAVVVVYIVLGVLYESLVHPLTILSTLPSAALGALWALMVCGMDFSVMALIGVVLLLGIVKKNAIMIIDFALVGQRERDLTPRQAVTEACLLRFRPIMMTTMAALLGGLPLALGQGPGSELRRPLGVTIVGGLLLSQVLTLYTTPVIYLAAEQLRARWSLWRAPGRPVEA